MNFSSIPGFTATWKDMEILETQLSGHSRVKAPPAPQKMAVQNPSSHNQLSMDQQKAPVRSRNASKFILLDHTYSKLTVTTVPGDNKSFNSEQSLSTGHSTYSKEQDIESPTAKTGDSQDEHSPEKSDSSPNPFFMNNCTISKVYRTLVKLDSSYLDSIRFSEIVSNYTDPTNSFTQSNYPPDSPDFEQFLIKLTKGTRIPASGVYSAPECPETENPHCPKTDIQLTPNIP